MGVRLGRGWGGRGGPGESGAAALLSEAIKAYSENNLETAESQLSAAVSAGARSSEVEAWKQKIRDAKVAAEGAARAAAASASTQIPDEPGTGTDDPDGTTPPEAPGDDKPGTTPPEADPDKVVEAKPAPKKPEPAEREESAEEPEEKGLGLQTIMMIVAGVLIIVTLLAKMFVKTPEEEEE